MAADEAGNSPELRLIRAMIEMLTGEKVDVVSAADLKTDTKPVDVPDPDQAQGRRNAGRGVEYDRLESIDETEQTRFSAEGAIKTADGNQWINENDAAFRELRVWTPDATDAGTLATLQERNVGALYLGHLATPFELRTAGSESLGAVRSSGVYTGEDGTMQQIDLAV